MLRDEISRKVWLDDTTDALAGMKPGAVAIECSTITPAGAHEHGGAISKAGIAMLEAPSCGSTPQADHAQLVFLIGGDGETLKRTETLLKGMGSSVRHAPRECRGTDKLITNMLMGVQIELPREMIGILKSGASIPNRSWMP
jgi:3-hydroxyisobutyrate dehydrogenase-like beta-hydroxyacid dehydrogenase